MNNQKRCGRILGLVVIAAFGMAPLSFALDDPETKVERPKAKPSAEEPAKKRHQRFVAEDAAAIKKRLEAYNKMVKREDRVHCEEEAVIGSNFLVNRCVTGEMRERERIFARREIQRIRRNALMQ